MIVGLYGSSCVGKTSVARALADALGWPLRSCGVEVRELAKSLNLTLADLRDDQHQAIDAETVAWARQYEHCLVEGRFLDAVLRPLQHPHHLYQLVATDHVRQQRSQARGTPENIAKSDAEDNAFRLRLFGEPPQRISHSTVDTSEISVDDCSRWILNDIMAKLPPRV